LEKRKFESDVSGIDHGKHPVVRLHLSTMDQRLGVGQITDGAMVMWMNTRYVHTTYNLGRHHRFCKSHNRVWENGSVACES